MTRQYSIAQARDHLARIVHDAEHGEAVELTRRGKPVAVLVGINDFNRLVNGSTSFQDAFERFRNEVDLESLNIDPEVLTRVRDRSPGREVKF